MFEQFYAGVVNLVTTFGNAILSFFPRSPFKQFIDSFVPPVNLGWFAWFFPISGVINVLTAWVAVMSTFYLVSVVARWVHILGD